MKSVWFQRISRAALAITCGLAFTMAAGCSCNRCKKPCCGKDRESSTTTVHEVKTEKH